MDIGIPRERKLREGRVALTPEACATLVQAGHQVRVERDAGLHSGFPDQDYIGSGCKIVNDNIELYDLSRLVVKVKEPVEPDLALLRSRHVLFCYLHLAAAPRLMSDLLRLGLTAYAFETLSVGGHLPLLAPMSAVAGRLAVQLGCHYLQQPQGGAGVLLGGIAGTPPGNILILGAGVAGGNAAAVGLGLGAEVHIGDSSPEALAAIHRKLPLVHPFLASPENVAARLAEADLVIGAVLRPGAAAPHVVTRAMLAGLRPGRVVVDIAIDQGGSVEGIRATDWGAPAYIEGGHTFIAVTNMPGAVPRTSSQALSRAILPWVEALAAGRGETDPALQSALALRGGVLVAEALKTVQAS